MSIRPIFAWYDLWVGAYFDKEERRLYIFPLPMLGFVIQLKKRKELAMENEPVPAQVSGDAEPVARMSDAELVRKHATLFYAQSNPDITLYLLSTENAEAALAEARQGDGWSGVEMLDRIRMSLQARLEGRNEGGDIEVMRLVDEIRQGDAQRNLAIIHKANPDDKYETVQEGIEAIISERNQALKNDEAGEARIAELEASAGWWGWACARVQQKRHAAEAERDLLSVTLGQVREAATDADSTVEFYLNREANAPANNLEACRDAREKLSKWRKMMSALSSLAPVAATTPAEENNG